MGEVTHTSEALVDGELATPETREVALSGGGDRRGLWERWFGGRKLGGQTPRRRAAAGSYKAPKPAKRRNFDDGSVCDRLSSL